MKKSFILTLSLLGVSLAWSAEGSMLPYSATPEGFFYKIPLEDLTSWKNFVVGYVYALKNSAVVDAPVVCNQDQINGFVVARLVAHWARQQGIELPLDFVPKIPVNYGLWHENMKNVIAIKGNKGIKKYNNEARKMAQGLLERQIKSHLGLTAA